MPTPVDPTQAQPLALDYEALYQTLDALATLGFIQRKKDTTCALKFLTWTGFPKFRRKFDGVLSLRKYYADWPACGLIEDAHVQSDDAENGAKVERAGYGRAELEAEYGKS
eukprot:CAMPEP_0170458754 /NCGR_PEP_ID=MMETSP0123-20130129/5635_1 /TAXON_ID=182087 /ORGANISM="Favella ehrenbergii, Strain Fehren 1" /LENGTH=110 /DNA_ID=CAMNT_0010723041 /DNA_START=157 /DNA_END=488 /DNA_ORIENTATION=+